jgi:hypothetical protein
MVLPVAPQIFYGIEFRRLRRKVFEGDPAVQAIRPAVLKAFSPRGETGLVQRLTVYCKP